MKNGKVFLGGNAKLLTTYFQELKEDLNLKIAYFSDNMASDLLPGFHYNH
jgi:hypothetical protein